MGQAFSTGLQSVVLEGLTDVIEDLGQEGLQQSLSSIGELLGNVIVLFGQFATGLVIVCDVLSSTVDEFAEARGRIPGKGCFLIASACLGVNGAAWYSHPPCAPD